MARQYLNALDVDTDVLAEAFERVADGLRTNDIGLKAVETNHKARADDVSTFELSIEFVASADYEDAVDAIEYEVDTVNNE